MVQHVTETLVNTGTIPPGIYSTVVNEQSLPETAAAPSPEMTFASVHIQHEIIEKLSSTMKTMKSQDRKIQDPVPQTAVTRRVRGQLKRAHRVNVTVRRGLRYGNRVRPYTPRSYSRGPINYWTNELSGKIKLNQRRIRTLSTYPFYPDGTTPEREPEPTEIIMCGIARCLQLNWTDLPEEEQPKNLRQKPNANYRAPPSTTTTAAYEEADQFVIE